MQYTFFIRKQASSLVLNVSPIFSYFEETDWKIIKRDNNAQIQNLTKRANKGYCNDKAYWYLGKFDYKI